MDKHIVVLAANYPPMTGGIARYLHQLISALPPDKVGVIALPTHGSEEFDQAQGYPIRRLSIPAGWTSSSTAFKFLAPFFMAELLRWQEKSEVFCGQAHPSLLLPAYLYSRLKKRPFGVFVYGQDIIRHQGLTKRIKLWLLNKANQIVVISSATMRIAVDLGIDPDRISLLRPSFDPAAFASPQDGNDIRAQYNLQDKKILLTVGRLVSRKGHTSVLQVLPAIRACIPEVHYLIAGDGPERDNLRNLSEQLGVADLVTFAGYVPENQLTAFYRCCDLFVMVSDTGVSERDMEGFGIVYLEANLFRKPVIAADIGGVSDAVIGNQTGILIEPGDQAALEKAIVELLLNPELANRLGTAGEERVLAEFTNTAAARKFMAILDSSL